MSQKVSERRSRRKWKDSDSPFVSLEGIDNYLQKKLTSEGTPTLKKKSLPVKKVQDLQVSNTSNESEDTVKCNKSKNKKLKKTRQNKNLSESNMNRSGSVESLEENVPQRKTRKARRRVNNTNKENVPHKIESFKDGMKNESDICDDTTQIVRSSQSDTDIEFKDKYDNIKIKNKSSDEFKSDMGHSKSEQNIKVCTNSFTLGENRKPEQNEIKNLPKFRGNIYHASRILRNDKASMSDSDSIEFKERSYTTTELTSEKGKKQDSKQSVNRKSVKFLPSPQKHRRNTQELSDTVNKISLLKEMADASILNPDKQGDTSRSFELASVEDCNSLWNTNVSLKNNTIDLSVKRDSSKFGANQTQGSTFEISPTKSFLHNSTFKTPSNDIKNSSKIKKSSIDARPLRKVRKVSTPHPKKSGRSTSGPRIPVIDLITPSSEEPPKCPALERSLTFTLNDSKIAPAKTKSTKSKKSVRLNDNVAIISSSGKSKKDSSMKLRRSNSFDGSVVHSFSRIKGSTNGNTNITLTPLRNRKDSVKNNQCPSFTSTPFSKRSFSESSLIQEKNNINDSNQSAAKSIRTKMPNFALIHQRQFEKMENIKEMQERKIARAKQLLSGQKPVSENIVNKVESEKKSRKQLDFKSKLPKFKKASPPRIIPTKIPPESKGYTRFGFKMAKNNSTFEKQEQIKAVVAKTKIKKDTREAKRTDIKGVRSNRRFELLMQMRAKK